MANDIIDTNRAALIPALASLQTSNPGYLQALVSAASDAVKQYAHRQFVQQTFSEYYHGTPNQRVIRLRQYPIVSVSRVASVNQCLQLVNTGAIGQRVTVQVTGTGIVVTKTLNGAAPAPQTFLFVQYPTIALISAAVVASGAGWSASIQAGQFGSYANFPSSDLKPNQGAVSALNGGAWLEVYDDWQGGVGFGWGDGGEDGYGWSGGGYGGWRCDPDTGELFVRYARRGDLTMFVQYVAGYASVPDAVQEATAQTALWMYGEAKKNPALTSERLGDYSWTRAAGGGGLPNPVKFLLSRFVDHSKAIAR